MRPTMRPTMLRRAVQAIVLGGVLYLAFGLGKRSFEAFCPFGGAEAAWGLFRERAYTCTLSEMNVAMLLGVLGLVLLAGKAFCSWVCPIGLISEMLSKLGRRIPGVRRIEVPHGADRWLRYLRYPFLALMLVLTWRAGELLLRGYDPFFLIFSGFGHGSLGIVSWISLGVVVLGTLFAPMLWCRYLCPLGALMDGLARFGLIRVHRTSPDCIDCGACDRVCLQRLSVGDRSNLASVDCTRCLECIESCPTGALELRAGFPSPLSRRQPRWRVQGWLLPVPVAAMMFAGIRIADPLTLPTAKASFPGRTMGDPVEATLIIEGVKCRGTSNLFIGRAGTFPGVSRIEAYAGLHRVVIAFDRQQMSPEALRDSINAPVPHPQTGVRYPDIFKVTSMKVKGAS